MRNPGMYIFIGGYMLAVVILLARDWWLSLRARHAGGERCYRCGKVLDESTEAVIGRDSRRTHLACEKAYIRKQNEYAIILTVITILGMLCPLGLGVRQVVRDVAHHHVFRLTAWSQITEAIAGIVLMLGFLRGTRRRLRNDELALGAE